MIIWVQVASISQIMKRLFVPSEIYNELAEEAEAIDIIAYKWL